MTIAKSFSHRQYAQKSLLHYWRVNLAVMLGIITGTAVLTGALIVGDSVRGSLQRLTIERLGRINEILIADHFFSEQLATRLQSTDAPLPGGLEANPAILFPQTTLEIPGGPGLRRATKVTLVGSDESFWELSESPVRPDRHPEGREIVINQPLADQLDAQIGDRLIVRLAKDQAIAADSTLADKSDLTRNLAEMEIIAIVPAEGLGRFSLQATQATPLTAYVPLETIQQALDRPDKINAILFAGPRADRGTALEDQAQLKQRIRPTLDDAGLNLSRVERKYWNEDQDSSKNAYEYFNLSTDRMVFSEEAHEAINNAFNDITLQPVMTYLANSIARDGDSDEEKIIPYSTITAIDSIKDLGPLLDAEGNQLPALGDGDIVLNSWAATDLGVKPGDKIRVSYFEPESTHGEAVERSELFTLRGIVPLTEPLLPYTEEDPARYVSPPSAATDPDLTPTVPGITDQQSIDEWDPPFPFDYGKIRKPKDEDYWDAYRTTPKAFVSLATGQKLWQSRFGQTTSFRIPINQPSADESIIETRLEEVINQQLEQFGFALLSVKSDGLRAASGTTPFNLLFLGFSFFIIASAVMLVSLLSRLAIEQRATNAGLLLAVGLSRKDVTRLFLYEAFGISVVGAFLGGILGIAYAKLMIIGLTTWWVQAIVTPFLTLTVGAGSLILGIFGGILASLLTIVLTLYGLRKFTVRQLLGGRLSDGQISTSSRRTFQYAPPVLFLLAIVLAILATRLGGEAQAGAFFGSGAAFLIGALVWLTQALRRQTSESGSETFDTWKLIVRNLARNPRRSTLTIGLMASACFLIVAISAFRLNPTASGTGGFQLIGQTDQPIFDDLNNPLTREDVLGSDHELLANTEIFGFRVQDGDDASCRNLYQSQRPRVLGCPDSFITRFDAGQRGFGWGATAATDEATESNPWHLLQRPLPDGVVPVVLDKNTAMYSLHLYGGVGEQFEIDYGDATPVTFEVVGLLSNTVLQGSLIVSEEQLNRLFPNVSGYRYFLVHSPVGESEQTAEILGSTYSDQGWTSVDTLVLLTDLLAVQNTYLSTFQSLGGLGLLLGTFGLAAVQLRNVFERRHELATLRAIGFARSRLAKVVVGEHLILLLGGLGIGLFAALLAVLPHGWTGGASPPWSTLVGVLGTILLVGLGTGGLAVNRVMTQPTLEALRDE